MNFNKRIIYKMRTKWKPENALIPEEPISGFCLPYATILLTELKRLANTDQLFERKKQQPPSDQAEFLLTAQSSMLCYALSVQLRDTFKGDKTPFTYTQKSVAAFLKRAEYFIGLFYKK